MSDASTVSSRNALVTTSLDGRILAWSRGAQALFGWRDHEAVGRPFEGMVHEKHRAVDAQSVAEVAAGHCVRSTIVKQVRSDGTILPCLQTMVPQRDATGRVNAVQRIVFDLSSLQEAERALRRALAQAHDVAERTDDGGGRGALNEELGRTRREYLRVMGSEARRIAALVDELIETASAGALDLEHATVD